MQITISLDVYKALTAALSYDGQSYDDLLRRLLSLDSPVEPAALEPAFEHKESLSASLARALDPTSFHSRGLRLAEGTSLRGMYKNIPYMAKIEGGRWVNMDGSVHSSPSAAASAVTGTNVNGLRFWEALSPGDTVWRRLEALVRS